MILHCTFSTCFRIFRSDNTTNRKAADLPVLSSEVETDGKKYYKNSSKDKNHYRNK